MRLSMSGSPVLQLKGYLYVLDFNTLATFAYKFTCYEKVKKKSA